MLPLPAWHDYFVILAGAAATLIGAMFVVVSIGSGFLTPDRAAGIRTFLTPTVSTLSTALFGAILAIVPELDSVWFGAIVGVGGLVGLGYALHLIRGFARHQGVVRSDWFWYAIVPPFGYALLVVAAAAALRHMTASVELFAAALALMLIAGIRNAWDMIIFFVTRDRTPG